MTATRRARVCCLDLDTFFVSVERLLDPSLRGKAVVVGGLKGGRGVVTSASYEARVFGVRSGISIRDASALAPDAIFLPGRHEHYIDYSQRAREIVERFSPIVVAASIDEQYVDFFGCESLYRKPEDADDDGTILRVVRSMTKAIEEELGLPASAGVATSKSLAKVACTLAKPHGVRFVPAGEEEATLASLPVRKLPGIGPVSEEKLARAGIVTLAAARNASREAAIRDRTRYFMVCPPPSDPSQFGGSNERIRDVAARTSRLAKRGPASPESLTQQGKLC